MKKKIIIRLLAGILVALGVGIVFYNINESLYTEEPETQVMASGDNDYPEYLDEPQSEESYEDKSLDELMGELGDEVDKIIDDSVNQVLDPQEQFVYGLQDALASYMDSIYTQYGDPTRTASSINAGIELDKYFTDIYNYENIVSEEDLITSIEKSKFRSVCDRTIGDALYGNLEDIQYFVEENPNNTENVYVTYTGIDKETDMKYTIRFEVYGDMAIGVNTVYCNNRSVGGIEDVLAAVEYLLR